jgi:DNA invertase Pin-like site-specific DNA recombinase
LEAAVAGQRIGYVRVSTLDQNEKRQLEGQVLDRVFTDKASGRDTARPQLTELLRFARDGDTVVVHSMDPLARNLDDLRTRPTSPPPGTRCPPPPAHSPPAQR